MSKKISTPKKLDLPTVLAFERKLDPSDAVFYAGNWDEMEAAASWAPVTIKLKSVRGTISNDLKTKDQDPVKLDAAIEKANLQTIDVATLPTNKDTLKVQFTLRVLAGSCTPATCNNVDFQTALKTALQDYVQKNGFKALANLYAANLANGRFLWRNRHGAEQVTVEVALLQGGKAEQSWRFDALAHSLRTLDAADAQVQALGAVIAAGLAGERHVLLQVTAFVRIGAGQEVFPSQELILDSKAQKTADGVAVKKSKTLYHVDGVAAMHSQKIGNAIRTIDSWYEGAAELGPIAVEPYGSVTTRSKAYRLPANKDDFYSLLRKWVLEDKALTLEQQHFLMAVLIRGGVFSNAKESKGKEE